MKRNIRQRLLHVTALFCVLLISATANTSHGADPKTPKGPLSCRELLGGFGDLNFSLQLPRFSFHDNSFKSAFRSSRPHRQFPDAPDKSFEEVVSIFSENGRPEGFLEDIGLFWSQDFQGIWNRIPQRKAESDMMAAKLVSQRINEYKAIGGLVVVDSGHAHSVAIAVELAKAGYRPIIKMGHAATSNHWLQAIAAMKYYAHEMEIAKRAIPENAPIAIIMDAHRGHTLDFGGPKFQDYQPTDLPSAQLVNERYNNSLIWVTEGEERGLVRRDDYTPPEFQHYRNAGVVLYQHFANPYHNNTPVHAISLKPE